MIHSDNSLVYLDKISYFHCLVNVFLDKISFSTSLWRVFDFFYIRNGIFSYTQFLILKLLFFIERTTDIFTDYCFEKEILMKKEAALYNDVIESNITLISKIYQSFEALEETLGKLKLEEPLFITYVAKKSFAEVIFKNIQNNQITSNLKN